MKIDVKNINGTSKGKIDLPETIFGIEPNDHVVYLAVKAELSNKRHGTHKTKERGEVRGGGRKPWRQKGTGSARAGTSRSPLWPGGGTIFGPRPHKHPLDLPKKGRQLARKSAFAHKAKAEAIVVLDDALQFEKPSTRSINEMLESLELANKKVLLLTSGTDINLKKSCRNIPRLRTRLVTDVSAYEILNADVLLFQKTAIETLEKALN